jgi:predicted ribosomally synthesized peptide with SipW-like signal peptide
MKMQLKVKQIIALVVIVALLMAGSVLVTMAYLTSQDTVTNTFTVGKVSITLDETDVDEYGVAIENAERVKENEYKLIPGHTYLKDPTVHVEAGSEESYLRMMVTVTDFVDLCAAWGKTTDEFTFDHIANGFGEGWALETKTYDATNNECVFEYRFNNIVDASTTIPALFDEIEILDGISNEVLNTLGEMKIVVVAHAIQEDGFADADEAWDAFEGGEEPTTTTEELAQPDGN